MKMNLNCSSCIFLLLTIQSMILMCKGIGDIKNTDEKNVKQLPAAQFDQFCDLNTNKCDRLKFLTCGGNSRCKCYDDLTFDTVKKICALKNEEPCPPNSIYNNAECLSNAGCINGVCTCNPNYYNRPNINNNNIGICTLQASYNEPCTDFGPSVPCSTFQNLQCTLNKCQCNPLTSAYSTENSQCVGKIGSPCINSKCVPGAMCSRSQQCICNPDDSYTSGADCLLRKGERSPCLDETECQKSLKCNSGFCGCDNRDTALDTSSLFNITTRKFNSETFTKCVGLADKSCIEGLCISNAYCIYTFPQQFAAGNLKGVCSCYRGNKTENNFCRADIGENCTSGKGCSSGLVCRENVCSCEYPLYQMYEHTTKSCKSKIRGPCRKSQDCNGNGVCSFILGIFPPTTGHCTCPSGYIESADGNCDIEFGNSCSVMNTNSATNSTHVIKCDRVARLSCINNYCSCSDKFYDYDKDQRKCKGLVGAVCNAEKSNSDCINEALCLHPFAKTLVLEESERLWNDDKLNSMPTIIGKTGRCKCKEGTVETEEYKCK